MFIFSGNVGNAKFVLSPSRTANLVHKYACQHCSYTTSNVGNYKTHSLIHTGERPFTCTICSKGFTQKHVLQSHLFVHAGIKPYVCQTCKRNFRSKSNLYDHKVYHG
ncbi:Zinc finger protein 358, partial [Stegodyphus mimosarum]